MRGGVTKYDYEEMEQEYIGSDISIRALAEKHGIKSFSTVAVQAKQREWERKRREFKDSASRKQIEQMASTRAIRISRMHDTLLDAIQAAVYRWAQNLTSSEYVIRPAEFTSLVDTFLRLSGADAGSSQSHSQVNQQVNIFEGMDPETYEQLISVLRPRAALARRVGPDPLPALEDGRPN